MKKLILIPMLCVAVCSQAWGVPVTYSYTTNVASQGGNVPALSALLAGLSVSGTFVYDSQTPLTNTQSSGAGLYLGAVTGWTGTVGSYSFSDANNISLAINGNDTFPFGGTTNDILLFSMGVPGTGPANGFSAGGFTLDNVRMFWIEALLSSVPDFLSSNALIDPLPSFGGRLALDFGTIVQNGVTLPVNVFFENLQVTRVPEPMSGLLLLSGLLMMSFCRRFYVR